jgi:hypothetical protein
LQADLRDGSGSAADGRDAARVQPHAPTARDYADEDELIDVPEEEEQAPPASAVFAAAQKSMG